MQIKPRATSRCDPTFLFIMLCGLGQVGIAQAQEASFDASWYDPGRTYLKMAVTEDGVYRVTGEELARAGLPLGGVDPSTLRLFENGREIPLYYAGSAAGAAAVDPGDALSFIGRRNRGDDESWAYNNDPGLQSSTFFSLYTDTTYYWLTWGGPPGLRYEEVSSSAAPSPSPVTTYRDTLHLEEQDNSLYYAGDSFDAGHPLYTRGEGFYGQRFWHGTQPGSVEHTYDAALSQPSLSGGDTLTVQVRLSSQTASQHRVVLNLQLQQAGSLSFVPVDTVDWSGYAFQTLAATVPQDRLPADGKLRVRLTSFNDFGSSTPNGVLLDWTRFSYVRSLSAHAGTLAFTVEQPDAYTYTLTGFTASDVFVYSTRDRRLFEVSATGATVSFSDAPTAATTYWAVAADGYRSPASLQVDTPSNWADPANGATYVIVTTALLRPSAENLAAYRASDAGGGHEVAVVDLQDVFDQFDYGRPTPIALRRFVQAAQGWARPPHLLLLWGDALHANRTRPRRPWDIPSFGQAPSDGWYAMQQAGPADWSESLGIGRIPIRDDDGGALFLQKIQQYEAAPLEQWQKRAMFLVGGNTDFEQRALQGPTLQWSQMAASTPAGLDTLHFFKKASTPLDPTFQDSLRLALRQGAAWLSYFGHSASQTWEIVTDPPRAFDNAEHLPIVLSLGCYTGDFAGGTGAASDGLSLAEQLVVETQNGGIAHWGASSTGTIGASAALSMNLHEQVFQDTVRVLGRALSEAKSRYATTSDPNPTSNAVKHLLQYGLMGDPATQIALPTRPDFHVTPAQITITPIAPIPADSQLTVEVRVQNLGLVPADSVTVQLTHGLPDGRSVPYAKRIPPFNLQQHVLFSVPIDESTVGEHRLLVTLDPTDEYQEEEELNNAAEQTQVVLATGLSIISPADFGLVDTTMPALQVGVAAREAAGTPVVFQLDTIPSFDSPALREHRTTAPGLSSAWEPADLEDRRTYFWRTRVDDPDQEPYWTQAAFTVRTDLGKRGWLQQGRLFRENQQSAFLEHDEQGWRFKTYTVSISASAERGNGTDVGQFVVSGEIYERLGLGFGLLVLDGNTGQIKGVGSMVTYENDLQEDPTEAYARLKALAAQAAPGDYVLTRTRHLARRGSAVIADSVKAIFRELGSQAIDTLTYDHLWIMAAQVGAAAPLGEWVDPPGSGVNEIVRGTTLSFSFSEGETLSPPIGPAQAWHTLGWEQQLANTESSIRIDVVSADGTSVLLGGFTAPAEVDLSALDPRETPVVRLRATMADTSQRSTPQLVQWHVSYEEVADLALDPVRSGLSADTLQEGQPLEVSTWVQNLSRTGADRAVLRYRLTNAANETVQVHADTLHDLTAEATAAYTLPTEGLTGNNRLQVVLDQPELQERNTFNNVLIRPFFVQGDLTPPSFDVLIDGEAFPHDPNPVVNLQDPALPFVSFRPGIEILIQDDNPYFSLEGDTSVVTVTLDGERIPYTVLTPEPAEDGGDNRVRLHFEPDLSGRDTTHTLVVAVRDASGNPAENSPYQVHFRTQSEMQVESVYPYPNPMRDFTVFAFRLRGADAGMIEDLRLRIYTINGRVIREFDLMEDPSALESGLLRIGWNKLLWDGRDEDGDLVATGVYLYKVFIRTEGRSMSPLHSASIEKLVVIR